MGAYYCNCCDQNKCHHSVTCHECPKCKDVICDDCMVMIDDNDDNLICKDCYADDN